jgi:glyoxylate/hydroxypyruvate reductase A
MTGDGSGAGRGVAGGIVVAVPGFEQERLLGALRAAFPDREVAPWPEVQDKAGAEVLVCFRPPSGIFAALPGLRLVHASGAGVDSILRAPDLPEVPVLRVVDPRPARAMARHVVYAVLHLLGHHHDYAAQQRQEAWRRHPPRGEVPVAVLGLGEMGRVAAEALAQLGLKVTGWSRSPRDIPGIACRHGEAALDAVLAGAEIAVVLLPLTPETTGLIDARRMALMPKGAAIVAAGRGGQVVEADLLAALDAGHLSGAHLDVFEKEPLPAGHPLWSHPRVTMTPHIASPPDPQAVARSVRQALAALESGAPLVGVTERARGY